MRFLADAGISPKTVARGVIQSLEDYRQESDAVLSVHAYTECE